MLKKIFSILLILTLFLNLPTRALHSEEDPSSCRYTITTCDHSVLLPDGTPAVDCSYDLVQVSGVPGAASINRILQAAYHDFLLHAQGAVPGSPVSEDERGLLPYLNRKQSEITCNDKGIISILIHYSWYTGGTFDYGADGYTFDLRTGELLDMGQLLPDMDRLELLNSLKGLTTDYIRSEMGDDAASDTARMLDYYSVLGDMNYYVEPDGAIVLFYSKYAISYGAAGTFRIPSGLYARPDRPETTVLPSRWAESSVAEAAETGLVPASLQHRYSDNITRAEFCALAAQTYEMIRGPIVDYEDGRFSDCHDIKVDQMAYLGVVNGVSGRMFAPNATLTREQAATMLARLAGVLGKPLTGHYPSYNDFRAISPWAYDSVGQMQLNGIMNGINDGSDFDPQGTYTREQAIVTMLRLVSLVG